MLRNLNISNALKGQNHQHRATPCERRTEPLQALKGRNPAQYMISPFQGLDLRTLSFRRALPYAIEYKAFSLIFHSLILKRK